MGHRPDFDPLRPDRGYSVRVTRRAFSPYTYRTALAVAGLGWFMLSHTRGGRPQLRAYATDDRTRVQHLTGRTTLKLRRTPRVPH